MDAVSNGHQVNNRVKVVLGAQWGDEGKGKLVDLLAEHADVVARCQVRTCIKMDWVYLLMHLKHLGPDWAIS